MTQKEVLRSYDGSGRKICIFLFLLTFFFFLLLFLLSLSFVTTIFPFKLYGQRQGKKIIKPLYIAELQARCMRCGNYYW